MRWGSVCCVRGGCGCLIWDRGTGSHGVPDGCMRAALFRFCHYVTVARTTLTNFEISCITASLQHGWKQFGPEKSIIQVFKQKYRLVDSTSISLTAIFPQFFHFNSLLVTRLPIQTSDLYWTINLVSNAKLRFSEQQAAVCKHCICRILPPSSQGTSALAPVSDLRTIFC